MSFWFWIDLASLIPTWISTYVVDLPPTNTTGMTAADVKSGAEMLGVLRMIRLLRLIKIARVVKATKIFKRFETSTEVRPR